MTIDPLTATRHGTQLNNVFDVKHVDMSRVQFVPLTTVKPRSIMTIRSSSAILH